MGTRYGGRPRQVDRDRILAAARTVGFEALSMNAVARELGVSATAVYRHVASSEALVDLCVDAFSRSIRVPSPDLPWREYLAELARAFRRAYRATPGAARRAFAVGPATPAGLGLVEQTLSRLLEADFEAGHAWRAFSMVVDYATTTSQKEEFAASRTQPFAVFEPERLGDFPALERCLAAVLPPDLEAAFESGLALLLDGVEQTHARHSSSPVPREGPVKVP